MLLKRGIGLRPIEIVWSKLLTSLYLLLNDLANDMDLNVAKGASEATMRWLIFQPG